MAIQNNFSVVRPSLLLDFANSKRLDPRITFTRASTARYYDGSTVAKAEENLFGGSQAFDGGFWAKTNSSVTADSTTAPDGTSTADTFNEGATAGVIHILQYNPTGIAASTTYAMSFFAKNIDMRYVGMSLTTANSNYSTIEFDLDGAGAVNRSASLGTGATVVSSAITAVGGSWFRCQAVITTSSASVSDIRFSIYASDGTSAFDSRGRPTYNGASKTVYLWGAQLEQRSAVTAYTATTTAPITNYVPVLQTAASGVPRFDHNPITGESLGLLIEEQRTNSLTYSEDFSNAAWGKSRSTAVANTQIAPDGTLTADSLIATTVSGTHRVYQSVAKAASAIPYTFSCYVKAAGYGFAMVRLADATENDTASCGINLATGETTVATAGFTNASGASINVGNGWWRVSITATTDTEASVAGFVFIQDTLSASGRTFVGNDYAGLYIWGAQLEAGAFPTSYIPTVAASATRSADAASMTGTNFSSWYDAAEGTLFINGTAATTAYALSINDNTSSNAITLVTGTSGTAFWVDASGTSQAAIGTRTLSYMYAGAYKVNDFAVSVNGAVAATDTSGIIPANLSQLNIGTRASGSGPICGAIRKIAYYPARLTNAQLQAITG